jgi:D-alanyl-D-alanine carboxypeptidase
MAAGLIAPASSNANAAEGQPLTAGQSRAIAAIVRRSIAAYETPGASVAVLRGGRLVYAAGFGTRDAARRQPADARTRYGIGSVTKTLVAALVLRLVEQRRMSLDDRVTRWLPAYANAHRVRVRDLLTQTSGIRDYNDALFIATVAPWVLPGHVDRSVIVKALAGWPLAFEPGTRFAYSNSNYLLLGTLAERATGKPLAVLLREQIFDPLGMHDTALGPPMPATGREAAGFTKTPVGPLAVPPWNADLTYAAGGVRSTVLDLARFDVALCAGRVVSPASFARMTSQATLANGARSEYGMGFHVYDTRGQRVAWHDGTVLGYKAMHLLLPATCAGVVVLANADYFESIAVALRIQHEAFGLPGESGDRFDANLPRWSMLLAAALGIVPLALSIALRRRRRVALVAALATYVLGAIWLPAALASAAASAALIAWPARSGRAAALTRRPPLA